MPASRMPRRWVSTRLRRPGEPEAFAVWEENWPALQLFLSLRTQWCIVEGMGGASYQGLNYTRCMATRAMPGSILVSRPRASRSCSRLRQAPSRGLMPSNPAQHPAGSPAGNTGEC